MANSTKNKSAPNQLNPSLTHVHCCTDMLFDGLLNMDSRMQIGNGQFHTQPVKELVTFLNVTQ